jgi:hypothetical protein
MLKKADKLKLKAYGFDVDKLVAAITAEDEQDFAVPEIKTYSDEDLTTRDDNVKKEADKIGYERGKTVGKELLCKDLIKKYSLKDIDGKDPEKLLAALDTIVTGGDAATTERINLLQKDKEKLEASLTAEKETNKKALFDTELITSFPAGRKADMTDKEYLMLLKGSLEFGADDTGLPYVKKDGAILRDSKTQGYVPVKDAVSLFFNERKFVGGKAEGGRGGDDNAGGGAGGIKTISQAQDQYLKDNPSGNVVSPEAQLFYEKAAKETTDFNWDA